jgi:hypothetical protein
LTVAIQLASITGERPVAGEGEGSMDSTEIAASDPRVRAILTEPDAYFTAALRRAWPQAGADIQASLDRRARNRNRPRLLAALRRWHHRRSA